MTIKKPHGNKKESTSSNRVDFRCTEDEKTMWNAKAKAAGHSSLSSWLKKLANEGEV